jgi:hypothetical protein
MSNCNGAPAELCALSYVEGILPEAEAERFEEHYFECPVCLDYLQSIQAVGAGLARQAADEPVHAPTRRVMSWPVRFWALGAAAAILVVGAVTYRVEMRQPAGPAVAHSAPLAPVPAPTPAAGQPAGGVKATEIADLVPPAFVAPNLRGDSEDAHFQEGMSAYGRGDCTGAVPSLTQVPAESRDSRAAEFYAGVCLMHVGDLTAASASLRKVAGAGDSPQQESAYYYLAQVALAHNDPASGHKLLLRTIALKGDLERKAMVEDRKVLAIVDSDRQAAAETQRSK